MKERFKVMEVKCSTTSREVVGVVRTIDSNLQSQDLDSGILAEDIRGIECLDGGMATTIHRVEFSG
jgi:hypothetical protein